MSKKFQRKIEDFKCENCGAQITGNGYTNHCPFCLFSKHVDLNPGDRAEQCAGLMRPESIEIRQGQYYIWHLCQKCGQRKINKAAPEDNFDAILKIAGSSQV